MVKIAIARGETEREKTVESVFNVAQIQALPVTFDALVRATRTDPILGKVHHYTQSGWPERVPEALKPYWNRRWELTVERGGVLWAIRVLIPTKLREEVLGMLHDSHNGIVSMKRQARSLMWWPVWIRIWNSCVEPVYHVNKCKRNPLWLHSI